MNLINAPIKSEKSFDKNRWPRPKTKERVWKKMQGWNPRPTDLQIIRDEATKLIRSIYAPEGPNPSPVVSWTNIEIRLFLDNNPDRIDPKNAFGDFVQILQELDI